MTTNSDITVFNKRYCKAERTEKFYSTKIKGVSFYSRKGTSFSGKNLSEDDGYVVRIPADADMSGKTYVDEMTYANLDDSSFSKYWTLQPGAIIVRGLVDMKTASEIDLRKSFSEIVTVKNYTDNRDRCSEALKHWRVGGE